MSPISAAVERFGDKATEIVDGLMAREDLEETDGFLVFFPNLTILGCYSPGHPRASLERFT